jgi:hypothetical protein|tara:strand:+ start:177 stop:812 length:636 start_codon:yes stop_codon:yes gene_type:complete
MSKLFIFLLLISLIRFILLLVTKKSQTFSGAISSSVISFLATCGYLLPIHENLEYYDNQLDDLPFIRWLLPPHIEYQPGDPRIKIATDPDVFSDLLGNVSQYSSFFVFFAIYFIIIRYGKKYNIDYFIRYNVMHSILIMLLQVPITYFYVELVQFLTLNQFLKSFTQNLATSLIIVNFFIIFYAMYYAVTNRYVNLPIITDACELHVGKKE